MKSGYPVRILSCAIAALPATLGTAVAQTAPSAATSQTTPKPSADRTRNEETIEVHGTRSVRTHLQRKPVSATTVDKRQIQLNQITDLPEALRLEPSVQF